MLQLRGQEVGEALRREAVHVVDQVRFARVRIDEDARAGGHCGRCDLEHFALLQGARGDGRDLAAVRRVAGVGDAHVHDVGDGRRRRPGRNEGDRGAALVVGDHRLLDGVLDLADVLQRAHGAGALEDAAARDQAAGAVVDEEHLAADGEGRGWWDVVRYGLMNESR